MSADKAKALTERIQDAGTEVVKAKACLPRMQQSAPVQLAMLLDNLRQKLPRHVLGLLFRGEAYKLVLKATDTEEHDCLMPTSCGCCRRHDGLCAASLFAWC